MPAKIDRQDLLDELHRLADELGRTPTRNAMNEQGKYSRGPYDTEFGSWNDALAAAGFEVNKPVKLSREDLLAELERLADEIGTSPTMADLDEHGRYSNRAYKREFGTWNDALRAAGLEVNKPHGVEYPTKTCPQCGEEFEAKPSRKDYRQYCSRSCLASSRTGADNAHPNAGKRVTKECEWCGEEFEVNLYKRNIARFCSNECKNAIKQTWVGEDHPRWNGGKLRYYGPNWHRNRRAALSRDGYECQHCGISDKDCRETYGQGLEVHHKTPIKQFENGDGIDYKAANDLDNLVCLCRSCHQRAEEKLKADS